MRFRSEYLQEELRSSHGENCFASLKLQVTGCNHLLCVLPLADRERISSYLEPVHLDAQQILYDAEQPIEWVYFPLNCVVSLLTVMENGETIEVATVGREGIVGLPILLGVEQVPGRAMVQIPGEAIRLSADILRAEIERGSILHQQLQHYAQALFDQVTQLSACDRLHSIEQRLCRWLLMTQDRVGEGQFPLTQAILAQMLGVRRATVSEIAGRLQRSNLIRYRRGQMEIVDRSGLENLVCECYGKIRRVRG
ncbi:Crp/Fnr family transcriptional regulator [Leptolyngbya ohadii]|uniref:Crp/Fnr family transcriptional regulator n=1 Tax=Leptolyngbya ohadii TaxID=1962290 RepID=UPI000B59B461|nr:Crp/Fnr family transcriptional regulator [Leptolyngbya ohadii]